MCKKCFDTFFNFTIINYQIFKLLYSLDKILVQTNFDFYTSLNDNIF